MDRSVLLISLDFELMTGVFDNKTIKSYGKNIEGARLSISKTLNLFKKYNIHCTWATVGSLFYEDIEVLKCEFPSKLPSYHDPKLSLYNHLVNLEPHIYNSYYSALELINLVKNVSFQEIATHTFSHYYCLENGQNIHDFKADLKKSVEVANSNNITIKSIVFPRNQINIDYLKVCKDMGLTSYRGVESSFYQKPKNQKQLKFSHRLLRLIDSYVNISGSNSYKLNTNSEFVNLPASFFFRPFSKNLFFIEWFKLIRLKNAMTTAAKKGEIIHIWWHPHNHGMNIEKNINQLESLLKHFLKLKLKYNMLSLNMSEISDYVKRKKN